MEDVCVCRVILNSDPAALVLRLSVSLPWLSITVRMFAQYFLFHQVGPKISDPRGALGCALGDRHVENIGPQATKRPSGRQLSRMLLPLFSRKVPLLASIGHETSDEHATGSGATVSCIMMGALMSLHDHSLIGPKVTSPLRCGCSDEVAVFRQARALSVSKSPLSASIVHAACNSSCSNFIFLTCRTATLDKAGSRHSFQIEA